MPDNDITVDKIQIKITQESTSAVKGIKSLATALQGLKTTTAGGIRGLTTIANQLLKLNSALSGIPDLSRLEQLQSALSQIKNLGNINISTTGSTGNATNALNQMSEAAEEAQKTFHEAGEQIEETLIDTQNAVNGIDSDKAAEEASDSIDVVVNKIDNLNRLIDLQKQKISELQDYYESLFDNDDTTDSQLLNAETSIERAKKSLLSLENELTKAMTAANAYTEGGISNAVSERFTELTDRFTSLKDELDNGVNGLKTALENKSDYSGSSTYRNASTFADNLSLKLDNLNAKMAELRSQFTQMQAAETAPSEGEWASFESKVRSVVMQMRTLKGQCDRTTEAVEKIGDAAKDAQKKSTGFVSKFTASLKRISLYRIIRSLLKQVASAISDGINNYVQYSEEANAAVSELKAEWQQLSGTLGITVSQLLIAVTPLLTTICDLLIDIINNVNYFLALISGKSSYSKAIKQTTDYADSLNDVQNSLLGIDEINKLSDNDSTDYSSMFEEVSISDSSSIISSVLLATTALSSLFAVISSFASSKALTTITTAFTKFTTKLKNMSSVTKAATSIAALSAEAYVCYTDIYNLATGSESLGSVLLTLIPTLTAVGVAMTAMYGPIGLVIAAVVAVVSAVVAWTTAQADLRAEIGAEGFWTALSNYKVTLSELSAYMEETHGWTVSLAEATEEYQSTLDAYAEDISALETTIQGYMSTLEATGKLTSEEAESMSQAISDMVTDMQDALDIRMTSIWNAFTELTESASNEFIDSLGDMKAEYLAFQSLFNDTTSEYESRIEELIAQSATDNGLTSEEVSELNQLLDYLTALNTTVTVEYSTYDDIISDALANGVTFESVDDLTDYLSDLTDAVTEYQESLETTYKTTLANIKTYQAQLDALYAQGALSDEDYASYTATFTASIEALKESYNSELASITSDVEDIMTVIQSSIANAIISGGEAGQESYNNLSGWGKFWNSLYDYVRDGLNGAYDEAEDMISAIDSFISDLGLDSSISWLSDWYNDIMDNYGYWTNLFKDDEDLVNVIFESLQNSLANYTGYATGGLPDSGEIFIARENGIPEMVGSWGSNHTAVANNQQIVDGIKQGVYEAMVEAGGFGDSGNITVQFVSDGQIKSEQIITAAERRNRRDGKKVISVEV